MNRRSITTLLFFLLLCAVLSSSPASGATTEVRVVKYAADGYTVLAEKRVDYHWMEANLPVYGDGMTHYYHQGPVFVDDPEDRWNPPEDTNCYPEKDMGAVKGTNVKDLCDLVGGMEEGNYVVVRAADGLSRPFAYKNVYNYGLREGPIVLTWYVDGLSLYPEKSYPDTGYSDGMRLVWFADTSVNPWGEHIFGNWDWHESADEEYWYFYYGSPTEMYPTTTGLSVKYISEILIYSQEEPLGSIGITSRPAGAIVVLDGMETDYTTPCVISDLEIGSYAVTVRLDGYIEPYEEWVEVVHDTQSDVHFTLEREDSSGDELYFESEEEDTESDGGGRYTLLPVPATRGRLHLLTTEEPDPGGPEIPAIAGGRLYLFCAVDCTGNTCPEIEPCRLDTGGTPLDPEARYHFTGDSGSLEIATFGYTVSDQDGIERILDAGIPDTCDGCGRATTAALVVEEDPDGPPISVLIGETADIPGTRDGSLWPGRETVAEFQVGRDLSGAKSALLFIVSTSPEGNGGAMYRVTARDRVFTGEFDQSVDGMGTAVLDVTPALSGETLTVGVGGEGASGVDLPLENRVVALVVEWKEEMPVSTTRPTPEAPMTESAIVRVPSESMPETPVPTLIPETITDKPGWAESISRAIGDLFWNILVLFDPALGERSDYFPGGGSPSTSVDTAGWTPREVVITVISDPRGADVSVDGQFLATTPCRLGMQAGETYDLLLVLEGYEPYRLDMAPEADRFLNVSLSRSPGETAAGAEPDDASPEDRRRYGGVYVTSYPGDLELRVDGKDLGQKTPAVVYGLKEGFHSVEVRRYREGVSVPESITSRVWVYRGAISLASFDLAGIDLSRRIRVVSEDEENIQFTVDGRYPVMSTPAEIDMKGIGLFVTSVEDESYVSYSIPDGLQSGKTFGIGGYEGILHTLDVTSEPAGAEIFLDGIRTGLHTPSRLSGLSHGYHRFMVTLPGHLPQEKVLNVPRDDDLHVSRTEKFILETYPHGSLVVESDPAGARIYIDGISTGEQTPCTFEGLTLGIHEVKLVIGAESRSVDAIVEPDRPRRYFIDLV